MSTKSLISSIFQNILGSLYVFSSFFCNDESFMTGFTLSMILFYTGLFFCLLCLCSRKVYEFSIIDVYVFIFLGVICFNLVFVSRVVCSRDYITWCGLLFLYIATRLLKVNWTFSIYLVIAGLIQGIHAVYSYFLPGDLSLLGKPMVGSFSNPAPFSFLLVLSLICSWAIFMNSPRKKIHVISSVIVSIFFGTLIIYSQSRASWLALVGGLAYLFVKKKPNKLLDIVKIKQYRILLVSLLVVLVICLVFMLCFYKLDSVRGRVLVWYIGSGLFCESPVTGHGISSFPVHYMLAQSSYFSSHSDSCFTMIAGNTIHAFNEFLLVAVEQGIVGLLAFVLLIYRTCKIEVVVWGVLGKALVIALLMFAMFSYPFSFLPFKLLFILSIASCVNYTRSIQKKYHIPFTLRSFFIFLLMLVGYLGGREYLSTRYTYKYLNSSTLVLNDENKNESPCYDVDILRRQARYYLSIEKYENALHVLERLANLRTTSEIYCELGRSCMYTGRFTEAEYYLTVAEGMVPSRVLPLRYLLQFYIITNNSERAREIAEKILTRKYKVVNTIVLRSKHEASQFLINQKAKGGGNKGKK